MVAPGKLRMVLRPQAFRPLFYRALVRATGSHATPGQDFFIVLEAV